MVSCSQKWIMHSCNVSSCCSGYSLLQNYDGFILKTDELIQKSVLLWFSVGFWQLNAPFLEFLVVLMIK